MRTDEKMAKICDSLKTLGCGSAGEKIQEAIELLDYPTTVRAEELSPAQFLEFYKVIVGEQA